MLLRDSVDLGRYPIDHPEGDRCRELVQHARRELADDGVCVLEGFLLPDAVRRIVARIDPLDHLAFHAVKRHNVYLMNDDPDFADDHPRNAKQVTTSATLGYDHLSDVDDLEGLYRDPQMIDFVVDALGLDALFAYDDPLAPINVLFYAPGTNLGWHFDNSTFTVTLMLRAADAGAAFEYVPFLRGPDDLAFDAVKRVVDGDRSGVRSMRQTDGTLLPFRGSRTVHRVTTVEGSTTRLLATLTYSIEPGAKMDAVNHRTFFGRE